MRYWFGLAAALTMGAFVLVACSSSTTTGPSEESDMTAEPTSESIQTSDDTTTAEDDPVRIVEDRTVVVSAGIDLYSMRREDSATSRTLTDEEISAVLNAIETESDLAWASSHTRALYGVIDQGEERIEAAFACDIEPVKSTDDALAAARQAANPPLGGGDCYGVALFSSAGELLSWRTNGES